MRTVLTDGDQRDYTAAGTPRIATVHAHTRGPVRRHRRRPWAPNASDPASPGGRHLLAPVRDGSARATTRRV